MDSDPAGVPPLPPQSPTSPAAATPPDVVRTSTRSDRKSLKKEPALPHVPSMSKMPPAVEDRSIEKKGRPPAASIGMSIIDRFWHLSDVLEDKEVLLSWRLRVMMAHDVAKQMKQFHQAGAVHLRLFCDAVLVNQYCRCKVRDTGSMVRSTDDADLKRDVLFFGVVLCQLALHQTLDLGGSVPRRSHGLERTPSHAQMIAVKGLPDAEFQNLKRLFASELAGLDTSEMSDNLDFSDTLAKEVRAMTSFAPKESEKVPESAIKSFEELAAQCCSALSMNRPDFEAIEDWLASIVDEVGGQQVKRADQDERDEVLWTMQTRDNEILGELNLAEESPALKPPEPAEPAGHEAGLLVDSKTKLEEGYDSDDSFQPPARQRRQSRLSMFIDDTAKLEPTPPPPARSELSSDSAPGKSDLQAQKAKSKRMSIKPSASTFARLAGLGHSSRKESLGSNISPSKLKALFDEQGRLSQDEALLLLSQAEEVLKEDANLPTMHSPVTVVGDLHGQYYDLINMLKLAGPPGKTQYLFLGDYVDRGDWSCEVLFYLLSLKIVHPASVTLIRGNHECDTVSSYFGFKEECERKYGRAVFYRCLSVFQAMPIGAILETGGAGRFLCIHGGISPNVTSLDQFERLDRFAEPGMNGFLCDVLWADPIKDDFDDGHQESLGDFLSIDYVSNPARGCSFRYGYSAIVSFLASNRLAAIIRAHEVQQEGYRYHFQTIAGGGKAQVRMMPPVITIFSAPNYLGKYANLGAFLKVSSAKAFSERGGGFKPIDLLEPVQFEAVKHPEPLVLESETEKQTFKIEQACPYMPTTFETFVHRALEFGRDDGTGDDAPALMQSSPAAASPVPRTTVVLTTIEVRDAAKVDEAANALRKEAASAGGMHGTDLTFLKSLIPAEMTRNPAAVTKETLERRNSLEMLKKNQGVKSLIAKYSQAAAVDGINEMHPMLVQEKIAEAKKKLNSAPPNKVNVPSAPGGAARPNRGSLTVFDQANGAVAGSGRRTLVAKNNLPKTKKSESWIKKPPQEAASAPSPVKPGDSPAAATASLASVPSSSAAAAASPASSAPLLSPGEEEVEFTEEEILALQLLYLMIDRDNSNGIDAAELIAWSTAEGSFIGPDDAQLCIESLDLDGDGRVGFSDYLSFAAALKQEYEKKGGAAPN